MAGSNTYARTLILTTSHAFVATGLVLFGGSGRANLSFYGRFRCCLMARRTSCKGAELDWVIISCLTSYSHTAGVFLGDHTMALT